MTDYRETCCCGASLEIRQPLSASDTANRLDEFRKAHDVCRRTQADANPIPDNLPELHNEEGKPL